MKSGQRYALVLAGGGAKGAYQIGAWKAFRELGIEFAAVAGASVGALNAALIAQGDFEKAETLWDEISLDKIVCIPPELLRTGQLYLDHGNMKHLKILNKSIIKHGGLDTAPLLNLIKENLNESNIRKAGIDLGLVTFNIGRLKPVELFLEDIPDSKLPQYLLASASFPAFKRTTIDGSKYTDGGIYDNIPFKMIKSRGYKNIIIVDISGTGRNRRPDIIETRTVYIKNSFPIGGILNFNRDILMQLKTLGYLDTMKVFGKRKGITYFYSGEPKIEKVLAEIIEPKKEIFRQLLPEELRNYKDLIIPLLECSAKALGLPPVKDYTFREMISDLLSSYKDSRKADYKNDEKIFRLFYAGLKGRSRIVHKKNPSAVFSSFKYYHAVKSFIPEQHTSLIYRGLNSFFPELPAALLFLETLDTRKDIILQL